MSDSMVTDRADVFDADAHFDGTCGEVCAYCRDRALSPGFYTDDDGASFDER